MAPGASALELVTSFDGLDSSWWTLARVAGQPFASLEFTALWWEHFGRGRLTIGVCRRPDGEIFALLPLYRDRRGPLRVLRFLGHGASDITAPICAPADSPDAWAAAWQLAGRPGSRADLLVADHVPSSSPAALPGTRGSGGGGQQSFGETATTGSAGPLSGATVLRREAAPVLRTGGRSWAQLLAGFSRNLRQQIGRRQRALARAGELRVRLTTAADRLPGDLDLLFALHARRWGTAGPFAGARAAFHRDFAAVALARGWLRLWVLELDSVPLAAWYGFRFADREWFYQAGREPAAHEHHVGFVLLTHTIAAAVDDGVTEYHFLR